MSGIFSYGREIDALRADVDACVARIGDEGAATSARIDMVERAAATRDAFAALSERLEALADTVADDRQSRERRAAEQAETLDRLGEAVRERDAAIEALRIEVARTQRQAAIDLEEVRTTARALAELLLRAQGERP